MKIFSRILDCICRAFKWVFSNFKNFFLVLFGILAIVFIFKFKTLNSRYEDSLNSISDTTTVYKNKVGELYHLNKSYIASEKELKSKNKELYDEIKNLKDNPLVVTKTEFVFSSDTIHTNSDTVFVYVDSISNDRIIQSNFSYADKWTNIHGISAYNTNTNKFCTDINSIEMYADLTTNFIERDKRLYVITKSSNPYLQINNTEGVVVSPENSKLLKNRFDKRWGVMVGVGPSFTIDDNKFKILPAIQVTLGYKIFSF